MLQLPHAHPSLLDLQAGSQLLHALLSEGSFVIGDSNTRGQGFNGWRLVVRLNALRLGVLVQLPESLLLYVTERTGRFIKLFGSLFGLEQDFFQLLLFVYRVKLGLSRLQGHCFWLGLRPG